MVAGVCSYFLQSYYPTAFAAITPPCESTVPKAPLGDLTGDLRTKIRHAIGTSRVLLEDVEIDFGFALQSRGTRFLSRHEASLMYI
jgi:hypothetical protein